MGHQTTQTFGLRAADESDTGEWKKFWSGSKNITLAVLGNLGEFRIKREELDC